MLDKIKACWENLRQQEKILKELEIAFKDVNLGPYPTKSDLTAIHSQLGELKYKTESLQERIGQNASAFSTQIGELAKKVERLEEQNKIYGPFKYGVGEWVGDKIEVESWCKSEEIARKHQAALDNQPKVYGHFRDLHIDRNSYPKEPEQPALEWEVLYCNKLIAAYKTKADAEITALARAKHYGYPAHEYEVRHNPKQVNKER